MKDLHHFEDAIARGNGVVVASMHFGSWEVGLAGWNKMGGKMALLAEVLRPKQLFDRVVGARRAQGVHIIPIDTQAMREGDPQVARRLGAASMREVFKVLRSGGVVAMALDRDLIGNGEPLEFFGQPAPIPIGVGRDRHSRRRGDRPDPAVPRPLSGQCGGASRRSGTRPMRPGTPRCARLRRCCCGIFEDAIRAASRAVARPRPHLAGGRGTR